MNLTPIQKGKIMTPWPHEDVVALDAFYGNPRGGAEGSATWQAQNLVRWSPPYPIFYSDPEKTRLNTLRVHKKCVDAFEAAFKDVLETLGHDYIAAHRLNISGGTYCFRVERGGSRLSVHSWGCAIDMDPGHNPFPHRWQEGKGMIDAKFAAILQKHGFCWRGEGHDIDPMHFQLCRHRKARHV
jgi:hypothetical protein